MKLSKNNKVSVITVDKKEKVVGVHSSKIGDIYVKSSANIKMNRENQRHTLQNQE